MRRDTSPGPSLSDPISDPNALSSGTPTAMKPGRNPPPSFSKVPTSDCRLVSRLTYTLHPPTDFLAAISNRCDEFQPAGSTCFLGSILLDSFQTFPPHPTNVHEHQSLASFPVGPLRHLRLQPGARRQLSSAPLLRVVTWQRGGNRPWVTDLILYVVPYPRPRRRLPLLDDSASAQDLPFPSSTALTCCPAVELAIPVIHIVRTTGSSVVLLRPEPDLFRRSSWAQPFFHHKPHFPSSNFQTREP